MRTLLLIVSPLLLLSSARAIPDNSGNDTIIFITLSGMRLEDMANLPDTWKGNAPLKGTWAQWSDPSVEDTSVQVQKLNMRAFVFGLEASEVTVQKRDDTNLRFVVQYEPDERGSEKILRQLLSNIQAWSGNAISTEAPLDYQNLRIRITGGEKAPVKVILEPSAA